MRVQSDTGPFAIVPEWVVFHPKLKAQSIRLYAVLATHADRKRLDCWPSRTTLAKEMGDVSLDTVDRAVKELTEEGAVVVTHRSDERGNTSNHYLVKRVIPDTLPIPSRTDEAPPSREDAAQNQNQNEPDTESSDLSDPRTPPQAASPVNFYDADKANEQVAALVDIAKANGRKVRGGRVAALVKRHGENKTQLATAWYEAIARNVAVIEDYVEGTLRNGQEHEVGSGGEYSDGGRDRRAPQGPAPYTTSITEAEAEALLTARARDGDETASANLRAIRAGRHAGDRVQQPGDGDG